MAEEVLSQAEVESLLNTMETSGIPQATKSAAKPPAAKPRREKRPTEKITPYDFKRPERVGKEQMRALQSLHEGFGRNFGAALSAMLRTIIEVKLTGVDQLTYSEFVFSLENLTCFNLLRADALEGQFILDINPSILYPIIDRMLGGRQDTDQVARRAMTEIELRLVSRITTVFVRELSAAWENVERLAFEVERVESNPHLVQIVPPNEVVVVVSFELILNGLRGNLSLCIPFNSIERFSGSLTANNWSGYTRGAKSTEAELKIARQLGGSRVEVVVVLAETALTTADLISLRVGDIITTEKDVHAHLDVTVEGVSKFRAEPGIYKGRKAIELRERIVPPALPAPE